MGQNQKVLSRAEVVVCWDQKQAVVAGSLASVNKRIKGTLSNSVGLRLEAVSGVVLQG